ncbi:MAG: tetratricopeptide repeat protein [Lachnospiraceae bacterium]|nr:tetratricopeptide repeat protein [Lachnospiraceae bacterium]
MNRALKILIPVTIILLLLVLFLGFLFTPSYIAIRSFLARNKAEAGDIEGAAALYEAILNRDPGHEDTYLAMADMYLSEKDFKEAEDVLYDGMKSCKSSNLAEELWKAYGSHVKALNKDEGFLEAKQLLEGMPVEELKKYLDDEEDALRYQELDGGRWAEACLGMAAACEESEEAQAILEDALSNVLNEQTDTSGIKNELLELYYTQAQKAEAGEDIPQAIRYYEKMIALDPQEARATEALARLRTEQENPCKLLDISINGVLTMEMNYHGLRVSLPVTLACDLHFDRKKETLECTGHIIYKLLSIKEEYPLEVTLRQDGNKMVRESGGHSISYPDKDLNEEVDRLMAEYMVLAANGTDTGKTEDINGETCLVYTCDVPGEEYLKLIPGELISDTPVAAIFKHVELSVTRYKALEDGHVRRAEAELKSVDNDALADIMTEYFGDDMSGKVKSLDLTLDIKETY